MNPTSPPTSDRGTDAVYELGEVSSPARPSDGPGPDDSSGDLIGGGNIAVGFARRPIPPKLYRIGEVVDYSAVSRQTIHNYTIMGLLRESCWTPGGHRLYDQSVFLRLDAIAELKARHKSLQEIREHFARLDGE